MKIRRARVHETHTSYTLSFRLLNPPPEYRGCGYGFECDKDGNVDVSKLAPAGRENYLKCQGGKDWRLVGLQYAFDRNDPEGGYDGYKPILCTGTWVQFDLSQGEVEEHINRQVIPAVGECNHCGHDVILCGFTNTCDHCGTDYNMSGQELAPREQWGEETGESVSDILSADYDREPMGTDEGWC